MELVQSSSSGPGAAMWYIALSVRPPDWGQLGVASGAGRTIGSIRAPPQLTSMQLVLPPNAM